MSDNFDLFRNPPDEPEEPKTPPRPPRAIAPRDAYDEAKPPSARDAARNRRAMQADGFRVQTFNNGELVQPEAPTRSEEPVDLDDEDDGDEIEVFDDDPELLDDEDDLDEDEGEDDGDEIDAALAARRGERSKRRRQPVLSRPRMIISTFSSLLTVAVAAVLVSTLFSLWTSPTFFSDEFRAGLNRVQATQRLINIQPTPLPTSAHAVKIGIVAGHSGKPQDPSQNLDPGAVCDDGLTELSVNQAVAGRVLAALQRDGYSVELMGEFDDKLENYRADVLLSIHSNDCQDYGPEATGYIVASAASRGTTRGEDERLLNCMIEQYGATTGLPRHFGVTVDMTEYHTFSEVSADTPVAIIELGFLRNDRAMLTQQQDLLAQGIANGIRCFLRPDIYTTVTEVTPDAPAQ
ncbi:MAG TPA: N-acetylmuramoyl-L-alanine amidase [Aggregatilinea sp.]|uniref:N-acetylmuramoyl-L-alanine amidase n=1 Tax=Aggregatilinea sp. TaxID=2806333 RepID=UPI002C28F36C|nr:N-acetylmuramoyl-L-alanine amidase [Aggregatilinea sp.]HML21309.1 N-acetylmuramoyl-L-alanine amidase [Aggregatilinea sp.]